ncbi:MAG: AAA family ATPase [Acidimicrobiales bacterium]
MSAAGSVELDSRIIDATHALERAIGSALLGKGEQVRLATAALAAGEHLLLNDRPGMGKTTLGAAIARVIDGAFGRIQGTPDLLPTDLTGASVYQQSSETWVFRPGPLLANVVLIDEVNRITPRTQSALLQAMAEDHVTVDGVTRPMPMPFLVVATMNPIGSVGTFALTSGQLDRFGAMLGLGPVERSVERRLLRGEGGAAAVERIEPVIPADLVPELQAWVAQVHCADAVLDYLLDLCEALRTLGHLSTRASHSLLAMARALAVLEGRSYVVPDDVRTLAVPCLSHRLAAEGEPVDRHGPQIRSIVEEFPVPDVPGT